MTGYNRIIIVGNLTREPDYKQLASGQGVCKLGVAANRQYKNKQTGNLIQEVCYIDVDVWGAQAESCKQFLQKGRPILVEGRIKLDTWKDNDGQTRSKHSIVADRVIFLPSPTSNLEPEVAATESKESHVDAQLEKNLLDQIEEIKNRTVKAKPETEFKEQAPFQEEELPF